MAIQDKKLQNSLAEIEKEFGRDLIAQMGDAFKNEVDGISTGSLGLDLALGGRGFPRGRIVEIYGTESRDKTTIALHAIANAQQMCGVAAFIDVDHAFDPTWAKLLGVDLDKLLLSQPSSGEEAFQIVEMLVKSNAVDIVVIDSVAALVPKNTADKNSDEVAIGQQARLMSQALRALNPSVAKTRTCVVFLNQIRQTVDVMFGSPNATAGGLALKFYASCRLEIRRLGAVKKAEEVVGTLVRVKVVKNKIAPPFRTAEFEVLNDRGINRFSDLVNVALDKDVLEKSGSFFSFQGQQLGQEKENVSAFLSGNAALAEQIRAKVLEVTGLKGMTSQPSISLDSPEWAAKNARRMVLIRKKNREGLEPIEKAEFEELQSLARALVEAASPPPELFAPEIDAIIARKAAP